MPCIYLALNGVMHVIAPLFVAKFRGVVYMKVLVCEFMGFGSELAHCCPHLILMHVIGRYSACVFGVLNTSV